MRLPATPQVRASSCRFTIPETTCIPTMPAMRPWARQSICISSRQQGKNGTREVTEGFPIFDVLVAGGGNAALCAALSAAELGACVAVLESAPREFRGGNSRHTRNLRCAHDVPNQFLTDSYPEAEYFTDLWRVTGGETDEELARIAIHESCTCMHWMRSHGARFQP